MADNGYSKGSSYCVVCDAVFKTAILVQSSYLVMRKQRTFTLMQRMGLGLVGGGGDRSVTLLYDWSCGSESGCPHCPNHGVCESCDCAFCGPPCCNPFDPSCSGWVMGLGLSAIASTTKPGLSSATYSPLHKVPRIPKQADQHLS